MSEVKTKLDLDIAMYEVTLNLRPWKGKISHIRFIELSSDGELIQRIRERIGRMKEEGKYKRRTITSISLLMGGKL